MKTTKRKKCVFDFSEAKKLGRSILGGKGHVLAEMTSIGLPVPPGFIVTAEACHTYLSNGTPPKGMWEEVKIQLNALEKKTGKVLGAAINPLLVSVRSGAAVSMPGMMDTVLNLGLNDDTARGLIRTTQNERFCWDSYRRFIALFGEVVLGIEHGPFEEEIDAVKKSRGVKEDTQLKVADLKHLVAEFKKITLEKNGAPFPEDVNVQLKLAIEAIFKSWNSDRAKIYRKINSITGLLGTAVTVQSMVFGNMGDTSGTGVAFTRDPSTGKREFYGEFLINAQGEDVVAGIRTPKKISELSNIIPGAYTRLMRVQSKLEKYYRDMQDIEFTIEKGKLYILQSRNGKRTVAAAIKIATDMAHEKLISKKEAICRIDAKQLNQLLHPSIPENFKGTVLCRGLPASPGAATGKVVFTPEAAVEWTEKGEKVILVRRETSPEDIAGMFAAQGILTSTGGMTSHAAVVCRGMGKCCVAGCADIQIDYPKKLFTSPNGVVVKEGDVITLNGTRGEVLLGEAPLKQPKASKEFKMFMSWVDKFRTMKVRTNADTPNDAAVAREFGAEGIGLCRTEHMFFDEDRISHFREMILAETVVQRKSALNKLLPIQQNDFEKIFKVMDGYPVTIRLLDPPLHEFLPHTNKQFEEVAAAMKVSQESLIKAAEKLHEVNPMLGHRGCRLAITFPEIYEMQVEAILKAAISVRKKGIVVKPEIEIPFIIHGKELLQLRRLIEAVIARYRTQITFGIKIGTMIELPRACLIGDELAAYADFFSFGTNDLTQMTFGISRDDAGKFLPSYLDQGIFERDPTETIDENGVGKLMKLCCELGRKTNKRLEIGICGEHGGEAQSVKFCHSLGLDYVSCSPYRVPIAKLAAAQAFIIGASVAPSKPAEPDLEPPPLARGAR